MPARAQFRWFLAFLGLFGLQVLLGLQAAQEREARVELEPKAAPHRVVGAEVVLDAALFWLDPGSVDEALLVAGSVPLDGESEIDLSLSFHALDALPETRFRNVPFPRTQTVSARSSFDEARHLPSEWDRPQVGLRVSGRHSWEVEELHALSLVLRYQIDLQGPFGGSGTSDSEDSDLLLPTGGVAALRKYDGDLLLLVGVRRAEDPFDPHRAAQWRDRLLACLELPRASAGTVADVVDAVSVDRRPRGWIHVDPALQLAVAGVALADVELCERAGAELSGSVADLHARIGRSIAMRSDLSEARRWMVQAMVRSAREITLAAAVACGVVPLEELSTLTKLDPAPPHPGSPAIRARPADWLRNQESPLRLIAISPDAALVASVVDLHAGTRRGTHFLRYLQGALSNESLGRTEATRTEWRRLRATWLAQGGLGFRLLGQGAVVGALSLLWPWLLALALVLLPARRSRPEPRLSRAAVVGLLLLSAVHVDALHFIVFAVPVWWWLGRRWLVSGRRTIYDRILVFLLVGATGEILGYRLGVTGVWGAVEDWTAAAQALGFFFLGRIFLAQEAVWHVRVWTVVLGIVVLAPLANVAGVPGIFPLLALLAALASFMKHSQGGRALRALPA